ncbi:ABC transporter ATP-binding protein/permease [Defluviimonas sp. WL0050]|uniref:ABC transporter ATP-binding protein/permease n=1 Tax=Albidovulum litorale TaxID=2984134 RepID=A0ABT2ZRM0_9RHOB|nr:ABC transporter ATP-binding protein [Defluviimonas sp. WL0050]MCV2873810.1 ABC transporter ATP-binding protein/permease [Defluviimonas sp. WL0050]
MALAFVFMVLEGSTLAALSWSLKPLFDRVFVGGEGDLIWLVGGFILALFLIRATTLIINRSLLTRVAQKTSTAMQVDLLAHVLTLDGPFFQINPPGALIERVQGDTAAVQSVWSVLITGVGRDLVALVSLFGVAVAIDPRWTVTALVGAPLLILPTLAVQRYIRRKTDHVRTQAGQRATRLDEVFHGIAAVKLNRMEDYQISRFRDIVGRIVRAEVKTAASRAAIPALIDIVTGLGFFGVLLLAGGEITSGERTVGEFMSFFTAMALAFQPLRRLGDMAGTWQVAAASLTRLYRLFDTRPAIRHTLAARPADPTKTGIAFADVHLSYGDHPVLNGLSFVAEPGKTTALVGPSGAGKSTVFNLLTRMVDPSSGKITVGGEPIDELDLGELRDLFSVVSQEAVLFDETIRENVLLGRTDLSETALATALETAHVTEFVKALPGGLDTHAGPRGSALSGGQRQRVSIARAVLRNAPILLLDEATSALDAVSEALVQEALERLSKGRTTLVIAHRLATVRDADKIVVMDRGRVVEEGTHTTLVAGNGLYASLCRLQFSE